MKLATIRLPDGSTRAVRVDGASLVDLGAPDVGALLASGWPAAARPGAQARPDRGAPTYDAAQAQYAPVVPRPGKIVCVGLNYRHHIQEMGRDLPEHPTLFAKYPEALIGAGDDIVLPPESAEVDWEAELAVIIGSPVRRARGAQAEAAIAGFAVLNDVTMRDWQYRTPMWLQGKTWAGTTPLGPWLVTPDELPGGVRPALDLRAEVDGEVVQTANTADLVFDPVTLVEYISTILPLAPGDVIAAGTPGGVGHARKPPRYLAPGSRLVTELTGLGRADNLVVAERLPDAAGLGAGAGSAEARG